MTGEVDQFLSTLGESSAGRLPPALRGTIRFDLLRPGGTVSWLVRYADGAATAVPEKLPADCVVRIPALVFARLLAGRDHVVSILFRACASVDGELPLFFVFRRLLPETADSRGPALPLGHQPSAASPVDNEVGAGPGQGRRS